MRPNAISVFLLLMVSLIVLPGTSHGSLRCQRSQGASLIRHTATGGYVSVNNSRIFLDKRFSRHSLINKVSCLGDDGKIFVRLFFNSSNNNICFTRKGKMIIASRRYAEHRYRLCAFVEELVVYPKHPGSGTIKFRSLYNKKWYLGFSRGTRRPIAPKGLSHRRDELFTFTVSDASVAMSFKRGWRSSKFYDIAKPSQGPIQEPMPHLSRKDNELPIGKSAKRRRGMDSFFFNHNVRENS